MDPEAIQPGAIDQQNGTQIVIRAPNASFVAWRDRASSQKGLAPAIRRLFLVSLWLTSLAWMRPLALPDEGRYVEVAREMLLSGDWLVPRLDGLPFLDKPPLFYWLTAASMRVFGMTELAARSASLLAGIIAVAALQGFLGKWKTVRSASRTVWILVSMPLFVAGSQFANCDALVACCITITTLAGADAALRIEAGARWRWSLLAAFVGAALGILAKGLIGMVLPGCIIFAWAIGSGRFRTFLRLVAWLPGWISLELIAAPWFLAMQHRFPGFDHYFFVVQHFERFSTGAFNNKQPFFFYPALLLVLTLPWPISIFKLGRVERTKDDRGSVGLLMTCWLAVVTVFFSMPQSKLAGYILPALPPLAFLVSCLFETELGGAAVRRFRATRAVALLICAALATSSPLWQHKSSADVGRRLHEARRPGEPVYLVGGTYLDLPFYAQLEAPPMIVGDWSVASSGGKDTELRTLADAAAFSSQGTPALVSPSRMREAICASDGPSWIVGPVDSVFTKFLGQAAPHVAVGKTGAWRVTHADGLCAN